MGTGTRYPNGIIDGIAHTEGGSATLVAGVTVITTGLVRITGISISPAATPNDPIVVVDSGANVNKFTVTDSNLGRTYKLHYTATGPRTAQY